MLIGCTTKDLEVKTEHAEGATIGYKQEDKDLFAYQGNLLFKLTKIQDISKVKIKFASSEVDTTTLTIHKAGDSPFGYEDVKFLNEKIKAGEKYDSVTFNEDDLIKDDGTVTAKLQYLILNAATTVKKENIKQDVIMKIIIEDKSGKSIFDEKMTVTIP